MTDADIQKIAAATAEMLKESHVCRFNDKAASNVLALDEIMEEVGAGHGTLRLVIVTAKDWEDLLKQARRKALSGFLIGVACLLILTCKLWGPIAVKWISGIWK